jgi:hypothetical protein
MAQHGPLGVLTAALLGCASFAAPAQAVPVWATWTIHDATTATASLPDGRSAAFTGFPFSAGAGGGDLLVPAVPGLPSGVRPPLLTIFPTATAGVDPNGGDLYFSLDLINWGVDAETMFSIEDALDRLLYRLELLDATLTPLSLAGVQLSQHNMFFAGIVQDYDLSLDPVTGVISVVQVHDSGDPTAGRHSGMAVFSNLPASTRYVRLYVGGTGAQTRDGLRIGLSASAPVPEPSVMALLAAACVGIAYARGLGVAKR